jgi:hypothetical protein
MVAGCSVAQSFGDGELTRVFEMNACRGCIYIQSTVQPRSGKTRKVVRYPSLKAESANHSDETRIVVWIGRFPDAVESDCEMASTPGL